MPLTQILRWIAFGLCAVCILLCGILFRRKQGGIIMILGILAAFFLGAGFVLMNYRQVEKFSVASREGYQALQEDKQYEGYRIIVDGKIVDEFPEYKDDGVFSYMVYEQTGQIMISTKMMSEQLELTTDSKTWELELPLKDVAWEDASLCVTPVSVRLTYTETEPNDFDQFRDYIDFAGILMQDEQLVPFATTQYAHFVNQEDQTITHMQEAILDVAMDLDQIEALLIYVWDSQSGQIDDSEVISIPLNEQDE